jgi:hypothetical protein
MATRRRPHPIALARDLFVYAPIGFLAEAPRLVPELIEAGRERLAGAGGAGRLAVQLGQQRLAAHRPGSGSVDLAGTEPTDVAIADGEEPGPREINIEVTRDDVGPPSDPDEALAIPGYDQLAASQVVARLAGLSALDLDRVEAYEMAHRRRRTVLAKISQLRRD